MAAAENLDTRLLEGPLRQVNRSIKISLYLLEMEQSNAAPRLTPVLYRSLAAAAALLFVSACEQADGPSAEYRPGEAGTVHHALCLLGFAAIPLEEVATGHHLVQARINGTRASFVLDTGANVTVVDTAQAEGLGVSAGTSTPGRGLDRVTVPGAGGRARQVAVETFSIGSVTIRQNRIVTSDLAHLLTPLGRIAGEEVVGIIGQDVLKEHRATIDVAGSMLYLIAEDEDPSPVQADACRETERESGSVT